MTDADLVLAHAGPGATWQAMIVAAAIVLGGVVLAAGIGLVGVRRPGDLVSPVAGAAIVAGLGVLASGLLSDWIGWGLPLAVVALATLLLGALTGVDLRFPAPLPMGALALAGVGAWLLSPPLTVALHPPPEVLPLSDDAALAIVTPAEGEEIPAGAVPLSVRVTGGSIGPGGASLDDLPDDPEEAGQLTVAIEEVRADDGASPQRRLDIEVTGCTVTDPCDEVGVELPVTAGTWRLTVDLQRGDGTPLAPPVRTHTTFTAVANG
ncbi:MAG: hypothetical protein R6U94_07165 [Nitriliruptoraceae bacterium]